VHCTDIQPQAGASHTDMIPVLVHCWWRGSRSSAG